MAEEKNLKQAKATFDTLCTMLDEQEWHYNKDEAEMVITTGARGDDLPIELLLRVDPDKMLVSVYSKLGFEIPEDKRVEMAVAVSAANWGMVDGSFDYSMGNGSIFFRLTTSFRESLLGKELFEYMVYVTCSTVDRYNDKFLMLSKDALSLEDFLSGETA